VLALGATTNFFNAPGAEEFSYVLKDLDDAIKLRSRFIETFEKASEIQDPVLRKKILSFAIIGGGATGVELTGELEALFNNTFLKYYKDIIKEDDIKLYLINLGSELLAPFKPRARAKALEVLQKNGATVMLNTGVKEVKEGGLVLNDGSFLEASTIIWTAGVKPNPPMFTHDVAADKWGRIIVSPTLQIPNCPNVFVIGDMASLQDKDGRPLPMLAQVAELQGLHTGKNIKRLLNGEKKLKEFVFHSKGELASLGQRQAVANIFGVQFSGLLAWFLWRTVYLFKFISNSKKIKIAVDWTVNLFFPHDITKA
jgi:NADH dehydrogenase